MAIIPKPPGTVGTPNNPSSQAVSDPAVPNNPSAETAVNPAVPNSPTAETAVNPAVPNNPSAETAVNPAVPNNPSAETAVNPAVPNNPTAKAAVNPAVPNNPTAKAASVIPRTLTPLLNLDFAAQCYAQKCNPKTFNELFTYTRNSSATFINRALDSCGDESFFLDTDYVGNVENFCTYSEQIDDSDWTKANTTVTPNQAIAPDGTKTADLVYPTTSGTLRGVYNTVTGRNTNNHTTTFRVKYAGFRWIRIVGAAGSGGAWFDIQNGAAGTATSGTVTSIVDIGDGWYECSVTRAGAATSFAQINVTDGDFTDSATANGIDGVYIWGAQLTESAKPLPYVKTISSAVTQAFTESPRFEYDPVTDEVSGVLIEAASTNLVPYSEYNSVNWSGSATFTENDAEFIDRTNSATKATGATAGDSVNWPVSTVTASTTYTISIYMKNIDSDASRLEFWDNTNSATLAAIEIDWTQGDPETSSTVGSPVNITYQKMPDNWWRISFSADTTTGTSARGFHYPDRVGAGDSVYFSGAQLETSPFATSYIRTEGSTVSRAGEIMTFPQNLIEKLSNNDATIYASFDAQLSATNPTRQVINTLGGNSTTYGIRLRSPDAELEALRGQNTPNIQEPGWNDGMNHSAAFSYTLQGNTIDAYFDGVQTVSANDAGVNFEPNLSNDVGIGMVVNGTNALQGHVRKLIFYNQALTADEVSKL